MILSKICILSSLSCFRTWSDALKAILFFCQPVFHTSFLFNSIPSQPHKPQVCASNSLTDFPGKPRFIHSQKMHCSLAVLRLLHVQTDANSRLFYQTWCPTHQPGYGQAPHLHCSLPLSSYVLCPHCLFPNQKPKYLHVEHHD